MLADDLAFVAGFAMVDEQHTGTPEAAGLNSRELMRFVRGFAGLNLVGADIVEVAPAYDHAEITSIAAAHIAYEYISLLARRAAAGRS